MTPHQMKTMKKQTYALAFEGSESDQDDEVNFDEPESLREAYHELLSNSLIL